MEAKSTSDDHPLKKDANEGATIGIDDSSTMHQHRTQQNENEASSLLLENARMRLELVELRRKMHRMENIRYHQEQQPPSRVPSLSIPTFPNINKRENASTKHVRKQQDIPNTKTSQSAVVLELPVRLRSTSPSSKDHQSVSTTDERETVEPSIDIESHQSAAGLHHRSPNTTVNTSTVIVASSLASSYKTRSTELMMEDEISSSSKGYDIDDPLAEARGLIGSDSLTPRHRKQNLENDGIMVERRDESSAIDDENNPNHHQMTFCQSLTDRAGWLIGLLVLQSLSSFILARNEVLLQHHTVIVQFLTMLVGAGGNAGNQASVGVVRGIAVGTVNRSNARSVLGREFLMGVALSLILGLAGFIRAKAFSIPWMETIAITTSLFLIVVISVIVGATLPLCMENVGIDPAHSSTTIQVIMDITGVLITVHVSSFMLDSDFPDWLPFGGEMI